MTAYNVLVPPGDAAGTVFVPDRFSRTAFIFGPLWLLRHRVWRGLIGYATIFVLFSWALRWFGLPVASYSFVTLLLALFIGLEGSALRRAALERRGFRLTDVVISPDADHAEQVFFERWQGEPAAPAPPLAPQLAPPLAPPPAPTRPAPRAPDVLGLFPEAGGGR